MAHVVPASTGVTRHPLRQSLPPVEPVAIDVGKPRSAQEDVAFFLVSFASAFIILYGFII
jgi:hypothetical protein